MRTTAFRLAAGVILVALAVATVASPAATPTTPPAWPQFHGPDRTNRSAETGLARSWPEGGPPLMWQADGLGHGFSTVAVAGGLIYTTGNLGEATVITALRLDGRRAWQTANGPACRHQHPGARSTPTVEEGRLYHLNADGDLVCLDARTGRRLWHVNILRTFGGRNITWGLAESVLVDGDRVVCTPGGKTISMVALEKTTGRTVWTCRGADDKPGYASPIVFEYGGLRQIVTLMATSVVGVEAETGRLLWQVRHRTPFGENITMPIYHDGHVFVTSRTTGSRLLRLKVEGRNCSVQEVWASRALDVQHEGALLVDGHVYGTGLTAPGPWVCLDWATGATCWTAPGIGRASVTWADGRIIAVNHDRTVALVEATPRGMRVVSRFQIPEGGRGPTWAHPVVCGGRLYIRHGDRLFCYDISAK